MLAVLDERWRRVAPSSLPLPLLVVVVVVVVVPTFLAAAGGISDN
jgi:hypothetical protein